MLLSLSSGVCGRLEQSDEPPSQEAPQAAPYLFGRAAFGRPTLGLLPSFGMVRQAREHDLMQGAIDVAITTAVEPMRGDLPGGRRDGRDAGELGEGRLGTQPARVRPGDQELGGGERPDP